MGEIRIATQLYLMRREASENLLSVLEEMKAAGYDGVEFCGLFGHSAEEVRGWLDKLGLTAVANHLPLEALKNPGAEIEACRTLGCGFAVLGFLERQHRHDMPGFADTVEIVRTAAKAFRAAGLQLAYHNHNFEFQSTAGGNGLALLLDAVPELDAQFDAGWLAISGEQPIEWLRKYTGRYRSVHLKDYLPAVGLEYDFCPIGMGCVPDYPAIIAEAIEGGARWIIADQDDDTRRTRVEAATMNARYLRSLGY